MSDKKNVFPGVHLADGEERARENPKTFTIPGGIERRSLEPGQFAKVLFVPEKPVRGCTGERLWVQVTEVSRPPVRYEGTVANEAAFVAVPADGTLRFGPEHVLSIRRR